jgi:hypothetical protein
VPKTTKSIQALFSLIILVIGWGGWFILKWVNPVMNINWYPYLPATFWIMGMLLTIILEKVNKDNARKLVNIYMLLKLSKLVVAMIMILILYFINKEDIRLILMVFAVYYALYLLHEFYIFYITEKKIKQSK